MLGPLTHPAVYRALQAGAASGDDQYDSFRGFHGWHLHLPPAFRAEAQQVTLFDQTAQRNREFIVDAIGLDLLPKYCAPTGAASKYQGLAETRPPALTSGPPAAPTIGATTYMAYICWFLPLPAGATCGHTAADLMNAILLWGAGARVQYPNGEGNSVIWVPEADKVSAGTSAAMPATHTAVQ